MRKDIAVRQHDRQDCAAACIASIASYYGLKLPLITIREACGTDSEGTSIKGIIDACGKIGMSAKAFKSPEKNVGNLSHIPKPIILHLQKDDGWLHFVVLYGMTHRNATILDPADGRIHKVPIMDIEKQWTGYLVLMSPEPSFKKGGSGTDVLRRFSRLLLQNKKDLIPALLGSFVYIAIGLSTSLFLQQIIDKVLPGNRMPLLLFFGIVMFILAILSIFIGYLRNLFITRAGIKIDGSLIMSYIDKLLSLPLSFFGTRSSGELNSRISDAYRIRNFLSGRLLVMFVSVISLIFSFALLFTYYWKLALLTILFVPLYMLLYRISDKINKKNNREIIEAAALFEEADIETISAIGTIRYFDARESFSRKMEGYYTDMAGKMYRGGKNGSAFATGSDGITKFLAFAVLMAGSFFYFSGEITIGELVSFYSIAIFFSSPLMVLVESNSQITEAQIAAQRLFEILDLENEEEGEKLPITLNGNEDISFENVSFSYPGRMELLRNLDFIIPKGKITAISGENGCGKSTIASLLMRGQIPGNGKIRVDKNDISLIDLKQWRKYITIVPQGAWLFNGTILENIAPGEKMPDVDKILGICKKVALEETLAAMPKGLLQKIGEHGKFLSGGERQKVALARALYREPKVLILDEATASLDAASAAIILRLIKDLAYQEMTIIMITHDTDFTKIADNKIIISNAHSKVEGCAPN